MKFAWGLHHQMALIWGDISILLLDDTEHDKSLRKLYNTNP